MYKNRTQTFQVPIDSKTVSIRLVNFNMQHIRLDHKSQTFTARSVIV